MTERRFKSEYKFTKALGHITAKPNLNVLATFRDPATKEYVIRLERVDV